MKLSVVVVTFNRAAQLPALLDCFAKQTDQNFELVMVSDGSADNTMGTLVEYEKSGSLEMKILDTGLTDTYGLGTARNMGILEAAGQAVVILDDDSYPVPEFVAEHKKTVAKKTLTGGYRNSWDPQDPLHGKMQNLLAGKGRLDGTSKQGSKVCENNTCMYRVDWIGSGLFSEQFQGYGGMGTEFLHRLHYQGFRYQFNPRAMIYHHRELEASGGLTREQKNRQARRSAQVFRKFHPLSISSRVRTVVRRALQAR